MEVAPSVPRYIKGNLSTIFQMLLRQGGPGGPTASGSCGDALARE